MHLPVYLKDRKKKKKYKKERDSLSSRTNSPSPLFTDEFAHLYSLHGPTIDAGGGAFSSRSNYRRRKKKKKKKVKVTAFFSRPTKVKLSLGPGNQDSTQDRVWISDARFWISNGPNERTTRGQISIKTNNSCKFIFPKKYNGHNNRLHWWHTHFDESRRPSTRIEWKTVPKLQTISAFTIDQGSNPFISILHVSSCAN